MLNNLVNILPKNKFELSIWAGMLLLFIIVTRKLYFFIKLYLYKLKEIDKKVSEHIINISKIIEQYKKIKNEIIEDEIPKTEELEIKILETEEILKLKTNKTRSMSMEERWADYDKKRAMEKEMEQKRLNSKIKIKIFKGFGRSA